MRFKDLESHMNPSVMSALAEDIFLHRLRDYVGLRDYALSMNGAKPISEWSSPTRTAGFFLTPQKGPIRALQPDTHSCWPFAGSAGRLAVKLSKPVQITTVTVDHIPSALSLDISTAPRRMSIWGQVPKSSSISGNISSTSVLNNSLPAALAPDNHIFVQLLSFEYDIYAPVHIQQFSLPQDVLAMNLVTDAVILDVYSNWGSPTHTCIYRFRVHSEQ